MQNKLIDNKLGVLKKYLDKKGIQEISVNQPREIFIKESTGEWLRVVDKQLDEKFILNFIIQMAGLNNQNIDSNKNPILSCKIPHKNYRMQAVIGPCVDGSSMNFTIRINSKSTYPLSSYIKNENIRNKVIEAVRGYKDNSSGIIKRKNILIAAGVGVGKTSFLNSIIAYADTSDRVISVQDVAELSLDRFQNKVSYLVSRNSSDIDFSYDHFIDNAVRQAFDRLFIGEISLANTQAYLRMLNNGHGGCISTIHAESAKDAIAALVSNLKINGYKGSDKDIAQYCKRFIHLIIHLRRDKNFNYEVNLIES